MTIMKKNLLLVLMTIFAIMFTACKSSKDSDANADKATSDYQLVGEWNMTNAKISLGELQIPFDDSKLILKADKTGEISYKNLAGTAETAKFAWEVKDDQILLTDPNNEMPNLFVGLKVPNPLPLKISNYTANSFDVSADITAKQNGKDVKIALTAHLAK